MKAFSLSGVLNDPGVRANLDWEPFRDGVEISPVYRTDDPVGPSAAFLRYAPGAKVPKHMHPGFEHILVLEGSQSDENGSHKAGDMVINPPGTAHSVSSEEGCLVLAVWQAPVKFVDG